MTDWHNRMMNFKDKIYRIAGITLIITFVLAGIWEFMLKEQFYPPEEIAQAAPVAKRFYSLITTVFFVAITLVLPALVFSRMEDRGKLFRKEVLLKEDDEIEFRDGTGTVMAAYEWVRQADSRHAGDRANDLP